MSSKGGLPSANRARCAYAGAAVALLFGCEGPDPSLRGAEAPRETVQASSQPLDSAPVIWPEVATSPRERHAGVELRDGRVLVCGGIGNQSCEIVSGDAQSLQVTAYDLPELREFPTLTVIPGNTVADDRVLIAGGQNGAQDSFWMARLSAPASNWVLPTSTASGSLGWGPDQGIVGRSEHSASALGNNVVLVGGAADSVLSSIDVRSVDGQWATSDSEHGPRARHSATVLKDEDGNETRVLILGGTDGKASLATGFIYSLIDKSLTEVPAMPEPRALHTATLLDDGSVLIVGGESLNVATTGAGTTSQGYMDSAWRFYPNQPAAIAWLRVDNLVPARKFHAAARIGKYVVVAGGEQAPTAADNTTVTKSVVSFDPDTNHWTPLSDLKQARRNLKLLRLDATHLLASGGSGTAPLAFPTSEVVTALGLGQATRDSESCASGHSADGVCCNSDCGCEPESGNCDSCHTCAGTQPGQCTALSGDSSGRPACPRNLLCSGGLCATSCTGAGQECTQGFYCQGGACLAKKKIGARCEANLECDAGFPCVDGVCCESQCDGPCEACSGHPEEALYNYQAAHFGICLPIAEGQAPVAGHSSCQSFFMLTAGTAGGDAACAPRCDGKHHECVLPRADTQCTEASCAGADLHPARTCDGRGACQAASSQSCAPYNCAGTSCLFVCQKDADCVGNTRCNSGICSACDEAECGGFTCDEAADACRKTCQNSATDCTGGYYCHPMQQVCVKAIRFPTGQLSACSVGEAPGAAPPARTAILFLLGALSVCCAGRTRRQRRRA